MRTLLASLALTLVLLPCAPEAHASAPEQSPLASILITFGGARPMPAGTTALTFVGSASLGSTALFTVTLEPQPKILLSGLPLAVNVLTIQYSMGAAGDLFTYTGTVPVTFTKLPGPALPRATMPDRVTGTTGKSFKVER